MKTLLHELDAYLADAALHQQSQNHLRVQRFNLLRTLHWLETSHGVTMVSQLTAAHLDQWFRHVTTRRTRRGIPLKITSVSRQIQSDRVFVAWLEKRGAVPAGLSEMLPQVRVPHLLPTSVLDHSKMVRLLEKTNRLTSDGHRLRAMMEVLYSSGMRVAELLAMDVGSVDLANGLVRVWGKGAKERVVPIGATARRFVESYLKGVRPLLQRTPGETALWLTRMGERMPYYTFRRQLIAHVEEAGIKSSVTAHTFRRSCATELIRGEASLWHVKDLLGHESIETLVHYVKLTIVDLKKTHKRCHPRERDRDAR